MHQLYGKKAKNCVPRYSNDTAELRHDRLQRTILLFYQSTLHFVFFAIMLGTERRQRRLDVPFHISGIEVSSYTYLRRSISNVFTRPSIYIVRDNLALSPRTCVTSNIAFFRTHNIILLSMFSLARNTDIA